MNSVPTDGTGKVANMAKQKYNINAQNYKEFKDLQAQMSVMGVLDNDLNKELQAYENAQVSAQEEHKFAEFVLSVVDERVGNKLAWSGEPVFLQNTHGNNTTYGGEVLEVLNGYSMQGLEYIAVNKYRRTGEYYASAIFLPDDFYIKNGELWINDIYTNKGATPHHYKQYKGTLTDGTQVSDLRTYDNSKKWLADEQKRLAKNEKLAELAKSK